VRGGARLTARAVSGVSVIYGVEGAIEMNGTELLTIKEFSDFTGVSQATLRYYDKIGLFSPIHRGDNDYRHYSPQQIITINYINVLSDIGISLKQIKDMEHDRSPEQILETLTEHEKRLDTQMRHLYESYSTIHILREMIDTGCNSDDEAITDEYHDETPIILGPVNDFNGNTLFYETFINFYKQAEGMGICLNYPIGGYFESMESFLSEPSQPTCFFSLDPHGHQKKPGGRYVTAFTRGYYGDMGDVGERLTTHFTKNKLPVSGPLYVIYVHDEISVKEPDLYLAQVSVLIR
jgi:DNA-binding transcriptional MerR regulator